MKIKLLGSLLILLLSTHIFAQEVSFLRTEEEAAQLRLLLTDEAKKEILVSYFIFDDDQIGLTGLAHLSVLKQKKPDLKIKLLIDASSNGVDNAILYFLETKGIEVKEFHPTPKLFPGVENIDVVDFFKAVKNWNRRMHDKLLIVDGQKMVTGGRNVKDGYYGFDEKNFHDRDVFTSSRQASQEARSYYLSLWHSKHTRKINYTYDDKSSLSKTLAIRRINETLEDLKNTIKLNINNRKNLELESFKVNEGEVHFYSSYDEKTQSFIPQKLSDKLFNKAVKAKKSLTIQTPYLLPTANFFKLAKNLQERNVKLSVITNSDVSTDVAAVSGAYDAKKRQILEHGIELYEFKGPDYLHAKSAVIDNEIALIGTYNLDPRSARINTEVALVIHNKAVAQKLAGEISKDMKNSSKVYLDGNTIKGEYRNCNKSFLQKSLYNISYYLSRFKIYYDLL